MRTGLSLWIKPANYRRLEDRLQRDKTAQQLRAHTACDIRRFESPEFWRFKATRQNRYKCKDQLILQIRTSGTYIGMAEGGRSGHAEGQELAVAGILFLIMLEVLD